MKKAYKIIYILIIITTICSHFYTVNAKEFWEKAKEFITDGMNGKEDSDLGTGVNLMEQQAKERFEEVIDFLWSIGLLTIFISTVILGIKYMWVSPEEKSRIKQATTPYIIGVIIIFGAVTIWKFIIDLLNGSL